jgi:DnaJ family protein C protein 3
MSVSAINDFQKAANMDEGNRRAQEGLNRAQKLLKQSKKRDYYKILGVKRYDIITFIAK